jgi:succinate dehydrogenase / fumarate reductase, membrane anchor subunit
VYALFSLESYAFLEVQRFIGDPMNAVLLILLTVTMAHHSWLGVQVVIEDYVHEALLKMLALIAVRFAHIFIAVAALYAIVSIGLNRL